MTSVAEKTKEQYYCDQFEIYQHLKDENTFSFFSIWKNPNEFKRHLKSDEFTMVLMAMKLLKKRPEIRYFKNQVGYDLQGLIQLRHTLEMK